MRKSSNSESLVDNLGSIDNLKLLERSKSVNDPNQLVMKKDKRVQFESIEEEESSQVPDEDPQ